MLLSGLQLRCLFRSRDSVYPTVNQEKKKKIWPSHCAMSADADTYKTHAYIKQGMLTPTREYSITHEPETYNTKHGHIA